MSRTFLSAYTKEFKHIVAGKDDYHALCICCNQQIDLSSIGKPSITKHVATEKHKNNTKSTVENASILSFAKSIRRIAEDEKVAAAESVWAYHIAIHGQSFSSADCVSS